MQPTSSDIDLFDPARMVDPYPHLEALQAQGDVVKLDRLDVFALTGFGACRDTLRDWQTFSSAQGVFLNPILNEALAGKVVLKTDGDAHSRLRRIVGAPLAPRALEDVKAHIADEAHAVVARLAGHHQIEAVTSLAQHLPVTIVSSLVGVPEDGRENLLVWAAAMANATGPISDATMEAMGVTAGLIEFMATCTRERVKPGGWVAGIWDAVDRGDISDVEAFSLMNDYIGPALETTIIGTSNMIELFAKNPDQYALLREQPELAPNAVNEALRTESVFHWFSRVATADTNVAGYEVPSGSRVVVLFGAANRDARVFTDPTRFDITRHNAGDHLALGHGRHSCAGGNLARMEMGAILRALVDKVARIEFIDSQRSPAGSLYPLEHLNIRLIPA